MMTMAKIKEFPLIVDSYLTLTPLVISAVAIFLVILVLLAFFSIFWWQDMRPQRPQRRTNSTTITRHVVSSGGVQEETLNKIPIVPYWSNQEGSEASASSSKCTICLDELKDGEKLRVLPPCNHAFHVPCIDAWFLEHTNCPVCRSPIACDDCGDEYSSVPTDSEDASPSDHHQQVHPVLLHRHSHSGSCQEKRRLRGLGMGLKRSLSMDQSSLYVRITIQRGYYQDDQAAVSTSSSSTTTKGMERT